MKPIIFFNSRKVRSFYVWTTILIFSYLFYSLQTVLEIPPVQTEDENDIWSHGFITNDVDNQQARYSYVFKLLEKNNFYF